MFKRWPLFVMLVTFPIVLHAGETPVVLNLSLKEALKRSQEIALNVLVADARVAQSLAQSQAVKGALLPQLSATLNGQRQSRDLRTSGISIPFADHYTGPFNTFDARARLTQTLFDPATIDRLKAARLMERLSKVQLEKSKEDALALVAVMYINAKRASQEAEALAVFVTRDQQAYELAKTEFAQGTKTLIDVKRTKADYFHSRYILKTARVQANQRRLDLAAVLHINPSVKILFDRNEDMALLAQRRINLPQRSLDVEMAKEQNVVAQAEIDQHNAELLPKVSLVGDYGRSGKDPNNASNTYTFGVMAELPLWLGGSQQAKIQEAKAKALESSVQLEDAKAQASVQVLQAKENISKAQDFIKAQLAQVELSRQQYVLVKEQYQNGLAQGLDVLRAKAQRTYDLDQYRESIALLWTSLIALAKAQGHMEAMLL